MRKAAYAAIAWSVGERRMESRNVARRKVVELAADLADILAHEDPSFNSTEFFRMCGIDGPGGDMALATDRNSTVDYDLLRRSAADPGENETHQGYKNYETFVVCNYLDNDQALQAESVSVALDAVEDEDNMDPQGATALREWFEQTQLTDEPDADAEDLLSGPASSLLNSALGEVDWLEVAQTRLQFAAEQISQRLEALRASLRAENISIGELIELQSLAPHINPGDVELLEAAGVPEFPDS